MTSTLAKRPFKVLGVQQIAIGGPDKQRLQKLWVEMLGLEVTGTFQSERENVDEDICAIGSGPFKVEVDLMQPIDPEKKPAVRKPWAWSASAKVVMAGSNRRRLSVTWCRAPGSPVIRAMCAGRVQLVVLEACSNRMPSSASFCRAGVVWAVGWYLGL